MKKLILVILSTSILAGCGDGSFNNSVTPEPTTQWADYTQENNGITYHKYDKELSGERAITTDCFFKLKSHLEGGMKKLILLGVLFAPLALSADYTCNIADTGKNYTETIRYHDKNGKPRLKKVRVCR
ncbi:hypothetical protein L1D34_11650 [Vibrio mediterranei]|uniref:hypothetical protein n=1 Tax=Vibrio mediterranei TaxID=689 RepID=UPI001EFD6DE5|nr:hypothetical protein [Vibrio mediterranei]MCG9625496.1 hypothetical protein [Vibrio mediterranei]